MFPSALERWPARCARRAWLGGALLWLALPAQADKPARTARSKPPRPSKPPYPLAPGRAFWLPELSPAGPAVALVNLHTQHVQVYRNGVAIGYSSASTGKPGHGTPTGLFTVLEKRRHHRSNLYNNAPMPWMVRLTWGGIAFHGGALPGYPASHGCIRLPMHFAPHLFGTLQRGSAVAVVRQPPAGAQAVLTTLAPIDPQGKPLLQPAMLSQPAYWAPEPAPAPAQQMPASAASASAPAMTPMPAPLSLLASLSQRRLFVLQDGQVLAAAALPASVQAGAAAALQGHGLFHWHSQGQWQALAGQTFNPLDSALDAVLWRQVLPADPVFAQRLRAALLPGSTLLVSALPAVGDVHVAVWKL
ncbi:MAG: L,D-transpeptidase family protein [Pseudomonadota bacterium]|nr:L,D-transpeptidase family protein [Pseudomonadota bacterium]